MGVVGDLIGEVAQLRLQAGLRTIQKTARHAAGLKRFKLSRVDGVSSA